LNDSVVTPLPTAAAQFENARFRAHALPWGKATDASEIVLSESNWSQKPDDLNRHKTSTREKISLNKALTFHKDVN
jgi:hypothetical protein